MFAVLIHNVHGGYLNNMKTQSNYRNLVRRKIFQRWDFVFSSAKICFPYAGCSFHRFPNNKFSGKQGPRSLGPRAYTEKERRTSKLPDVTPSRMRARAFWVLAQLAGGGPLTWHRRATDCTEWLRRGHEYWKKQISKLLSNGIPSTVLV